METVHTIYDLKKDKNFTEDQTLDLVNLFLPVSYKAKTKINGLNSRLEAFKGQNEKADEIQFELNTEISKWSEKIRRLGGTPLALYKVKIPTTNGYYIWEYPSADIEFFELD